MFRDTGNVNGDQIHGDSPHHRRDMVTEGDVTSVSELPRVPVGIARRDGCDASHIRGNPRVTVPDPLSMVNGTHLMDAPDEAGHRPHGVGAFGGRIDPEQRCAGARHVEVEVRGQPDS